MRRLIPVFVVLAAAVACSSSSGPGGGPPPVPDSKLHIVAQGPSAKLLVATQDSFWAKVGDGRGMKLFYQGATPQDSGEEFLRFEVSGDGLYKKPSDSLFLPGDSILIKVTVVDPQKLLFDFQPTGLRFSPDHPARLKVKYRHSDHDFNGDGVEDSMDAEIETDSLDLWRREPPDTLWFRQGAVKFELEEELDANISSFSQYAVAW